VETEATSTVAGAWEILVFDFANSMENIEKAWVRIKEALGKLK
jgi:hypothetical protein